MSQVITIGLVVAAVLLGDAESSRCSCERGSVELDMATEGSLRANARGSSMFIVFPIKGAFRLWTWHYITTFGII